MTSVDTNCETARSRRLELRDELEVLEVQRSYIEANMEGCGSDNQILESNGYAPRGLLTFDLPCEPSYIQRNRMHNHVPTSSSVKAMRWSRSASVFAR
jgi:hypothetical protein